MRSIVGGAVVTAIAGSALLLFFGKGNPVPVPSYSVARVIDGDTFETTEKQLIRLASVEAPELGLCGGEDAKKALERYVLGKPVYLKVHYRDPYMRLISQVYTPDGYINDLIVREGYATYRTVSKDIKLNAAAEEAREHKRGIYGEPCTQLVNKDHPKCSIKGNIREDRIYFTEDCRQYSNVVVELYKGDRWFCTEKEAQKAGFTRGVQCP